MFLSSSTSYSASNGIQNHKHTSKEVKCKAVFVGYVLDPVSNHVGICLKATTNDSSTLPWMLYSEPRRPNQTTLLKEIQSRIQEANELPPATPTLCLQISKDCLANWSELQAGVPVQVTLSRPSACPKRLVQKITNTSFYSRVSPWTVEQIRPVM